MRLRARLAIPTTVLTVGLALYGVALAQSGQGAPTAPAAATPAPGAGATPGAGGRDTSLGLQRPVGLSPEDMRKQGDQTVNRIESSAAMVRKMLEQARAERDVVKTLCLNDKLSQLDVTLRSAKERRAALESAANRRDTELSAHEFTILGVYRQRSERISVEANQCIGNEAGFLGDTRVNYSVDPTIPDPEPSRGPDGGPLPGEPFNPIIVPPPSCASCSL
ncbi:MAG TPA: hypothetical protein VFS43_34970 [Polyangiaceae bacterium]|nr:hypothetical protein [Polyangiaceae bacterium]